MAASELAVDVGDETELRPLEIRADGFRGVEVRNRFGAAGDPHALVDGRHETRAPVTRPVDDRGLVILHHDEGGQVGVLAADAVADPGTERGFAAEDRAGIHLADPRGVIDTVGLAGAEDREVVRAGGDVRDPVGEPLARLAMLLPRALGTQQGRLRFAHGRDDGAEALRQPLAGQLVEQGFRVEEVHLRRTAFHEEEDDALGARFDLADAGLERGAGGRHGKVLGEEVAEGHGSQAQAGVEEEVAAGRRRFDAMAAGIVHST